MRGCACSHADGPALGARLDESVPRVRRPERSKCVMAVLYFDWLGWVPAISCEKVDVVFGEGG